LFAFTYIPIFSRTRRFQSRVAYPIGMLINLLPDFFAVLGAADRLAAYRRFYDAHKRLLEGYWQNYVLDPDGPHFNEVARAALLADRSDLRAMLERTDVVSLAREAEARCASLLEADVPFDVVLMVGVGAANAGELVVHGRGAAFVCLEHFTSVANPETQGLGLDPELIPLWLGHEIAHVVRYTSPSSMSAMRYAIEANGGTYSYWDTARRVALGEHLVNEGLAVQVARQLSPGHAAWEYFGYGRRQFARIRESEAALVRAAADDLERAALGLRLRWLSGGMSDEARTVDGTVLPDRAGYFVGARLVEAALAERGLAWAIRAPSEELLAIAAQRRARTA
jgi:hypothetical protein